MLKMELFQVPLPITVVVLEAASFPEGILPAHQALHQQVPFNQDRRYFGLSRPEGIKGIVYRAAAEVLPNESFDLPTLEIMAGTYAYLDVKDYQKDLAAIDRHFQLLLRHPQLDPQGYCVEWYLKQQDLRCMVRILES